MVKRFNLLLYFGIFLLTANSVQAHESLRLTFHDAIGFSPTKGWITFLHFMCTHYSSFVSGEAARTVPL